MIAKYLKFLGGVALFWLGASGAWAEQAACSPSIVGGTFPVMEQYKASAGGGLTAISQKIKFDCILDAGGPVTGGFPLGALSGEEVTFGCLSLYRGGSPTPLKLNSDTSQDTLSYQLYRDSAATLPLGSFESGSIRAQSPLGSGGAGTLDFGSIYAKFPPGQNIRPGDYRGELPRLQLKYGTYPADISPLPACADLPLTSTYPAGVMSAKVYPECSIDSITPLNFGEFSELPAHPLYADGSLFVTCTLGTPYSILAGAGLHNSGTALPQYGRRLRHSALEEYLLYILMRHPSGSGFVDLWGGAVGHPAHITGQGTGNSTEHKFSADIHLGAGGLNPGTYSATVVLTLQY